MAEYGVWFVIWNRRHQAFYTTDQKRGAAAVSLLERVPEDQMRIRWEPLPPGMPSSFAEPFPADAPGALHPDDFVLTFRTTFEKAQRLASFLRDQFPRMQWPLSLETCNRLLTHCLEFEKD